MDVAVDIRRDGPTFGRHVAVELSSENRRQLFIPRGYAHGFVVLTGTAIVQYKVDAYYSREHERGLLSND
ncbi:MAG: dTDP-4-dehydrorhamnose 3,5-epimerase family protein, partial [Chloroflexi bacterium]|nr:dTDP-4-dehydrorhamnose 3,5-epimerase family protein [Chloroflexota bacterium]